MEHYRVVALDILGFGNSTRITIPKDKLTDFEEGDDYMNGWLEKWVEIMTEMKHLP